MHTKMSESIAAESKDGAEQNNGKRKIRVNEGCNPTAKKLVKKTCVSFLRPSYIPCLNNVRVENCDRINRLIGKLMRQHSWNEASGTLSVALKGTCKETSPVKNRLKYSVVMELLKRLDNDRISLAKIKHIYEIWMRKCKSRKKWRAKDRYVIQLEFVLFCLTQGNIEEAHQAVICLVQESEYGSDPTLNMMVGLIFYQLWYSTIQKDLKLRDSDKSDSLTTLEMSGTWSINPVENSDCHKAADMHEVNSPTRCDSNTSIRIDKEISMDGNPQKEKSHKNTRPLGFYMEESAEQNANEEASFSYHDDNLMHASIFFARGLDTCLLPIRLPRSRENLEEFMHVHRQLLNDHYVSAVKHLRLALYSTPPELAALLPLIQLLLLGDRVKEAMGELEKLCHNTNMTFPLRLRASITECFDRKQYDVLSTCYEDILKKDPTCSHSLRKLITMHNNGDYNLEPLVEMIAVHLDATYATCDIWGELALCFLKLSQYEDDQMSVCGNENECGGGKQRSSLRFNAIPRLFVDVNLCMSWKLRCRWWPRLHFSKNIHDSEMQAGKFQLLTCKAACASHLYGPEFEYANSVYTLMEKEDNKERMLFLRKHMNNSIKLLENLNCSDRTSFTGSNQ